MAWDDAGEGSASKSPTASWMIWSSRARRRWAKWACRPQLLRGGGRHRHADQPRHPRRWARDEHAAADQHFPRARQRSHPCSGTTPTVLGNDGEKLSKRHGATGLNGVRCERFICRRRSSTASRVFGWSHGNDEIFTPRAAGRMVQPGIADAVTRALLMPKVRVASTASTLNSYRWTRWRRNLRPFCRSRGYDLSAGPARWRSPNCCANAPHAAQDGRVGALLLSRRHAGRRVAPGNI